ncbi:MAG: hypothetical protein LUQ64_05160 [Methanomicrobiales archaeon]|nr:hypothetical protein [Methanomicrobiales archaeon]
MSNETPPNPLSPLWNVAGHSMEQVLTALIAVSTIVFTLASLLAGYSLISLIAVVLGSAVMFTFSYLAAYAILRVLFSPGNERWGMPRWVVSLLLLGGVLMIVIHFLGMLVFFLVTAAFLAIGLLRQRRRHLGTLPSWLIPDQFADMMIPGVRPGETLPGPGLPPLSSWTDFSSPAVSFRYPPGMTPSGSGGGNTADQGTLVFQSPTEILAVSWVRTGKGFTHWNEFTRELRESIAPAPGDPSRADEIQGEVEGGLQDRHVMGIVPIEYRKIGEMAPSRTAMVARWYCNDTTRDFTVRLVARQSAAYTRQFMSEFLKTLHCHDDTTPGPR